MKCVVYYLLVLYNCIIVTHTVIYTIPTCAVSLSIILCYLHTAVQSVCCIQGSNVLIHLCDGYQPPLHVLNHTHNNQILLITTVLPDGISMTLNILIREMLDTTTYV